MFPPLDILLSAGSPSVLWAYLDPGTGSLVFQILIAAFLSGAYCLRSSLVSVRQWFARGLSKE